MAKHTPINPTIISDAVMINQDMVDQSNFARDVRDAAQEMFVNKYQEIGRKVAEHVPMEFSDDPETGNTQVRLRFVVLTKEEFDILWSAWQEKINGTTEE